MIEDVTDTLTNTAAAVSQKFVRRNQIEASTCQTVSFKKWMSIDFIRLRNFAAQCLENCTVKDAKMNKCLPKKEAVFNCLHWMTGISDDDKMQVLDRFKKLSISRFPMHVLPFSHNE